MFGVYLGSAFYFSFALINYFCWVDQSEEAEDGEVFQKLFWSLVSP